VTEYSTQAYICPVCHDDHSGDKPHTFWPAELAAHDAELRAEIARAWDEGFDTAKRWGGAPMCKNPYRAATIAEGRTP